MPDGKCRVYNNKKYLVSNTFIIEGMLVKTDCPNCMFKGNERECKKFHYNKKLEEIEKWNQKNNRQYSN